MQLTTQLAICGCGSGFCAANFIAEPCEPPHNSMITSGSHGVISAIPCQSVTSANKFDLRALLDIRVSSHPKSCYSVIGACNLLGIDAYFPLLSILGTLLTPLELVSAFVFSCEAVYELCKLMRWIVLRFDKRK